MIRRSHPGRRPKGRPALGSLLVGLSATLIGVLVIAGCGGSHGNEKSAASKPPAKFHDAIAAPKATELRPGMSVRVRKSIVNTVGWQVACAANGKRLNAEAIRGQRTGSGELASFKGGTPSIWAKHNSDGSITVSCR